MNGGLRKRGREEGGNNMKELGIEATWAFLSSADPTHLFWPGGRAGQEIYVLMP